LPHLIALALAGTKIQLTRPSNCPRNERFFILEEPVLTIARWEQDGSDIKVTRQIVSPQIAHDVLCDQAQLRFRITGTSVMGDTGRVDHRYVCARHARFRELHQRGEALPDQMSGEVNQSAGTP
jgi:hypothetical protein